MPRIKSNNKNIVARNRRATFDFFVEETIETGIILTGTEVKALRSRKASIEEAYAEVKDGEVFIVNAYIPEYKEGNQFNHFPRRPRKLLLHSKEIRKLIGLIQKKGYSLIILSIYFNWKNLAKVELAIAKGKKQHDKRESIKERDWSRQKDRIIKSARQD